MIAKPLLILPFDHRSSFSKNILKFTEPLTQQEIDRVSELKSIIYEAFLKVRGKSQNSDHFGILVDEEYGKTVISDAKEKGINFAIPVEKSGLAVFDFEYGDDFSEHINLIKPTYVKVLVRYNPDNADQNQVQLERLKKLSSFCTTNGYPLIFELLVPPSEKDLSQTKEEYDKEVRPEKTVTAINEIKPFVRVDIWKLEGVEKKDWQSILSAIGDEASVIVLGRGENSTQVEKWLSDAAEYEQIIGFAVGRTVFQEPLENYVHQNISKESAVNKISENFEHFVDHWYHSKSRVG